MFISQSAKRMNRLPRAAIIVLQNIRLSFHVIAMVSSLYGLYSTMP